MSDGKLAPNRCQDAKMAPTSTAASYGWSVPEPLPWVYRGGNQSLCAHTFPSRRLPM